MTKQSLFYFSFTVPGQVKCFNKMCRGHRGQLFMNKHKLMVLNKNNYICRMTQLTFTVCSNHFLY